MISKFMETIKRYNMLQENDHIIIGLSGGADSITLLHLLIEIKDIYNLSLTAVHINHGIRGEEAYNDEIFVQNLCQRLNLHLEIYNFDIKKEAKKRKITEEEAGRLIRYKTFDECLSKNNATKIAVAHNMNDNAETMIMRFFRGTGIKGISGIPPVRGNIIRPLITFCREDIEQYCIENKIGYIIDSTNNEAVYMRNKIRIQLIPYIKEEINPSIVETLFRMSDLFSQEESYLNKVANEAYDYCLEKDERILISIKKLCTYPDIIQKRIIRIGLSNISNDLHDISYTHINDILLLANKDTGKMLNLPHDIIVEVQYGFLLMYKKENINKEFCYNLVYDKPIYVKEINTTFLISTKKLQIYKTNLYTKIFCYDKISFNPPELLQIRSRKKGDKIFISKIGGNKKIKDYFIDNKVPRSERDSIPLLANGSDIIWIIDNKGIISDKYKAFNNFNNKIYLYLWEENK